jgi:hypothetical protein
MESSPARIARSAASAALTSISRPRPPADFGDLLLGEGDDAREADSSEVSPAFAAISRPTPIMARSWAKLEDLGGEVPGADDGGAGSGQLGQIGRAADFLHRLHRRRKYGLR